MAAGPERKALPRLMQALILAGQGFRVFPVRVGGKLPAIARYPQLATTNPAAIREWWGRADYNIGIATGRPDDGAGRWLFVVDYDCKAGQAGEEMLRQHRMLGLTETMMVKTPNGTHCYFWSTLPIKNSVSKLAQHVDVRGWHGYVVAEGSVSVKDDGRDYYRLPGIGTPMPAPDALMAMLAKIRNDNVLQFPRRPGMCTGEREVSAEMQTWAREYLINTAPEAHESVRNTTAYEIACRIMERIDNVEFCFRMMMDYWNLEKVSPEPLEEDELKRTVYSAFKGMRTPPGSADPKVEFAEVITPEMVEQANEEKKAREAKAAEPKAEGTKAAEPKAASSSKRIYRLAFEHSVKLKDVIVDALIENMLPEGGLAVLYAQSGKGKTFVALDLSFHIATGMAWNGHATKRGLVLYVAAEGGVGIHKRMAALQQEHAGKYQGKVLLDVVPCPVNLLNSENDEDLSDLIKVIVEARAEHGMECVLIVIDTLSRALAGGDENSSVDMGRFVKNVDRLRSITRAAALVVHHAGKDMAKGARGWSGVRGAVDSEFEIDDARTLRVTKQRDMEEIEALPFRLKTVDLGQRPDGKAVSSCVVVWMVGVLAEMEQPVSPGMVTLLAELDRVAAALEVERGHLQPGEIKAWFFEHEPESRIARINIATLRSELRRAREEGLLPPVRKGRRAKRLAPR